MMSVSGFPWNVDDTQPMHIAGHSILSTLFLFAAFSITTL
jgi:hypothetical protein